MDQGEAHNFADTNAVDELQQQQQPGGFEDADAEQALANENPQPEQNFALPPEMMLTPEEHAEAWHIKETIEGICDEIDNLSDFMYGTLAIVVEGDMERALEIATQLQGFKEEYGILGTLEDGLRHMKDIIVKPTDDDDRFLLAIDQNLDGSPVLAVDLPKLDLRNFKSPEQIQGFFVGRYYTILALSPNFRAARAGHVGLMEYEGYKWKHNMMDMNLMKGLCGVVGVFPIKIQKAMLFNSTMSVNTMVSMAKSVLPKHIARKIQLGCKAPVGERLDQLYNIPSTEVAEERLKAKIEALLQRRYRNERTYRLYHQALEEEDGEI